MFTDFKPIQYLEEIVFFNGTDKIMSTYLGNSKLFEEGYDFHSESNTYNKFDLIEFPDSDNPIMTISTINRESYFKEHLEANKKVLFNYLKSIENQIDIISKIENIYTGLYAVLIKLQNSELIYKDTLETYLVTLIQDLKTLFPTKESHKVFRLITKQENTNSFFQDKNLKASFFKDLYKVTYDLDLIDDVAISEESFYDVFTTPNPNAEKQKIIFNTNNHFIAFFLKEIECFFYNLNPVTIEMSKSFFNKQGKLITKTDLYTSLSRNKNKNVDTLNKITNKINELKKTHLK